MVINEIPEAECAEILSRVSFGRLGCAHDNQPYVVPVNFAYESGDIYVISTLGQKIEWMRENPRVCVLVDEIKSTSEWVSIVANGNYQELREPQFTDERDHARKLLVRPGRWGQAALAERQLKTGNDLIATIFFRIRLDSMTGLRATPEP